MEGDALANYTLLAEDAIQEIASRYDLAVRAFEPIEGGAGNSSFRLHTQRGSFVLTVCDEKTIPYATKLGRLLHLLAEHRFPTTNPVSAVSGRTITIYREKPVLMKAYIEGEVHQELDTAMLRQVGAAMARLHHLPTPDFLPDEHAYGRQTFSNAFDRNIDPAYESWLEEQAAYLERHIPPDLPSGLIHGDLFFDNVLFENGEFKAIIDFEEACRYYNCFDLGMGVVGLCKEGDTLSLDKAGALVAGYQRARKLERREKRALQLFVEYAATATSYWRFWKYHLQTPLPKKAGKHWQMVRRAERIRSIPSTKFMAAVFV